MQKISVAVILLVAAFLFTSCGHDAKKVVLTPAPTQEESSYVIPSYGTDDSTEIVDISSPAPVSEEAPVDASASQPPRQEQEAPPPASEAYIQSNYVMIGDSRFVGMQAAIPDYAGFTWIDRVGAGSSLFFEYQDDILSLDVWMRRSPLRSRRERVPPCVVRDDGSCGRRQGGFLWLCCHE